jgi:hypothetical protein
LWAHLLEERKAKYRKLFVKLDADRAKIDADREEWKAEKKAFNEMMERREAERAAYDEKTMAERKADREEVAARLEAIHDKTDASLMKLEPEMEHQVEVDAWIPDMRDALKEKRACQEATEANPEKLEANPGENEFIMEMQEFPNEEIAINPFRACRKETVSCQVTTAACLDSNELNPEDMTSAVEYRQVPTEEAAVKS